VREGLLRNAKLLGELLLGEFVGLASAGDTC